MRTAVVGGQQPGGCVGDEHVEVAARHATERSNGDVDEVEDRLERGPLGARREEAGWDGQDGGLVGHGSSMVATRGR